MIENVRKTFAKTITDALNNDNKKIIKETIDFVDKFNIELNYKDSALYFYCDNKFEMFITHCTNDKLLLNPKFSRTRVQSEKMFDDKSLELQSCLIDALHYDNNVIIEYLVCNLDIKLLLKNMKDNDKILLQKWIIIKYMDTNMKPSHKWYILKRIQYCDDIVKSFNNCNEQSLVTMFGGLIIINPTSSIEYLVSLNNTNIIIYILEYMHICKKYIMEVCIIPSIPTNILWLLLKKTEESNNDLIALITLLITKELYSLDEILKELLDINFTSLFLKNDVINYILLHHNQKNISQIYFDKICRLFDLRNIKICLQLNPDLKVTIETIYYLVCSKGVFCSIEYSSYNKNDDTKLYICTKETISYLLNLYNVPKNNKFSCNGEEFNIFEFSIYNSKWVNNFEYHYDVIDLLLQNKFDASDFLKYIINIYGIEQYLLQLIELLLKYNTTIDTSYCYISDILNVHTINDNVVECIKLLIKAGINVNANNNGSILNQLVLDCALNKHNDNYNLFCHLIDFLIEYGINKNFSVQMYCDAKCKIKIMNTQLIKYLQEKHNSIINVN